MATIEVNTGTNTVTVNALTGSTNARLPAGGTTGQIPVKASDDDYDVSWSPAGAGDMFAATYDPNTVEGDVFAMENMAEAADAKVMTSAERTKLAAIEASATADQTGAQIKAAYEAESNTNAFTDAEQTKLTGIEASATANDTDANLKARANHTGTQTASTISDFSSAADARIAASSAVTANTAKVTNATHTGDVTGATALTIADGAVTSAKTHADVQASLALADSSLQAGFQPTYAANDIITLLTNTPTGGITSLIKFTSTTEYDRAWASWFDTASRHRTALGFHERDYSSGDYHDAFEIKTSADPGGATPSSMLTRFSIGTDDDLVTATINQVSDFVIRDGSSTFFSLSTTSGDVDFGDGTNEAVKATFGGRAFFGYDMTTGKAVVQGKSGKGISFCVNNDTFTSGQAYEITSTGKLNASDILTGTMATFGSDNQVRDIAFSETRASMGYDGSYGFVRGGTGKGVALKVNSSTSAVTISSAGIVNISTLPTHADEAAAVTAGRATGDVYQTSTGELRIKL